MKHLDPTILQARLETRLHDDLSSGRVGGAVLAVWQNGRPVYENCFGTHSPADRVPLARNAIFRMASMTKPVTAVAALSLIEEGKLSLCDPVARYLPAFARLPIVDEQLSPCGYAQNTLTVWHLLTHTSGLGGGAVGAAQLAKMTREQKASLPASIDYYAGMGLQFEPGSAVLYSGVPGFDVLGAILELVDERPLEEVLRRRIFDPCQMPDTTFFPTPAQWERMITVHDYVDGKAQVAACNPGCIFVDFPASHPLGGAGLVSTLDDYLSFAEMLQNDGTCNGNRVLSPASIAMMSRPHVSHALQPKTRRWGLAVKVVTDPDPSLPLGAWGWSGAYGTHFWIDPANRITAIYLKNSEYDGGGGAVTNLHFEEDVYAALI